MSELVIANKSDLVAIADAIREVTGVTDEMNFPNGFNDYIKESEEIIKGKWLGRWNFSGVFSNKYMKSVHDHLFDSQQYLTGVDLPACTSIGHSGFYNCPRLTEVNLPNVTSLCTSALSTTSIEYVSFPKLTSFGGASFSAIFYNCKDLKEAYIPNLDGITRSTFQNCSSLEKAEYPLATSIGGYAFDGCSSLKSIDFPLADFESVCSDSFRKCTSLISANLPSATKIPNGCFQNCESLTSVNLPSAVSAGRNAFQYCSSLENISLPSIKSMDYSVFQGCTALTRVNLPSVTSISSSYVFAQCSSLNTLVLGSESVCSLSNTSIFTGTPFASGGTGGTVYVPSALIESYQTATNWSTLYAAGTCNFVAIEGSEYE